MSTPWTMPSFAQPGTVGQRQDVVTLHDRVAQIADRVGQWQLQQLATDTGELLEVLTLPDGAALTTLHPRTDHMASPRHQSSETTGRQIASTNADASKLFELTTGLQWLPVGPGPGTVQREAFGRFIGYTDAVPLVAHHQGDDRWLCIGGIVQQAQADNAFVEFTVPSAKLQLERGVLGILYTLRGGTSEDAHWITSAKWAAIAGSGIGSFPRNSCFSPLYAIASVSPLVVTLINGQTYGPALLIPVPGFPRYPRLAPTGPCGLEPTP